MQYEVAADRSGCGSWRAEAINYDGDGECHVAIFSGPDAERLAHEYAGWKNAEQK